MFIQEFRKLAALAGKPDLPLARLAGNLVNPPAIDAEHLAEQITQNSPSVKRAQQDIVRAETDLKSAKRESVPDLQIHAGLQNNFEPINEFGKPAGLQGFVTAGIALPIFNRNQGNVAAARADLERAQREVGRVELSLRQAAQPMVQDYLSAQEQANRYKNEMIPRASRAYELNLAKYRQMAAAYPQVIVSQRTLFQLQVAYVEVQRTLWYSAIALQNFVLSNGLAAPQPSSGVSTAINLPQ
jgi:cobalt-zinc-cadmium efflux system outer membrane protein